MAVVRDGAVLAELVRPGAHGSAAVLPAMVAEVLRAARLPATELAGIAVTIGPGSFTGIRAALALAHGIAAGAGIPLRGVTVGDAIRSEPGMPADRPVWVAIDSRRNRVFLDDGQTIVSHDIDHVPSPGGPITLAGDSAGSVVPRLVAGGADVRRHPVDVPGPLGIAAAPARAAQPLYVDPPEARPGPAARPAPLG